MKGFSAALFFLLHLGLFAQMDQHNILNRDSFPPFVKTVTLTGYVQTAEGNNQMSSRYFVLDTTGTWKSQTDVYSDGDVSFDTVLWDPVKRTRTVTHKNEFEPGRSVVTYNKDGTVKSISNEPAQRDPQTTEFEYDNAKRVTKKRLVFVENLTVEVYLYDEAGRIINRKRSSGSVTAKKLQLDYEEKYEYQLQGDDFVMYAFYYGANESVRVRDTVFHTFNEQHLLVQKVEVMENGAWKRVTLNEYDNMGRTTHVQVQSVQKGEERMSNTSIEYDSLGYYALYVQEETSYGFSNRWTTGYNERGLPVETFYKTAAETFYYEWKYEYR